MSGELAACGRCGSLLPTGGLMGLCPRCFFPEEADGAGGTEGGREDDLPPGTVIAGHEILGILGRGGMGVVYRARHQALGREVALKTLPHTEPERLARFQQEARALGRLAHDSIVAVYDFGVSGGIPYISMELVSGCTLAEALRGGPFEAERARAVALVVLRALAASHACGVIHRDIKPENVLLAKDGRIKVADFGIAWLADEGRPHLTTTGVVLGTPGYVAPERLQDARIADPGVDVFSAGALLHEMLTGRPPAGVVELPGTVLDPVVRRALRPAGSRYPSAAAMARALEAAGGAHEETDFAEWLLEAGVALLIALAVAVFGLGASVALTPRILAEKPTSALEFAERLDDGRFLSWARFEPGWAVASGLLAALALAAYAALLRHWRRTGLLATGRNRPGLRRGGWAVLALGGSTTALWTVRRLTESEVMRRYVPIYGGALLLVSLFAASLALMRARRTGMAPLRQLHVWLGLVLAALPPCAETVLAIAAEAEKLRNP